jgi:hypothetical protein
MSLLCLHEDLQLYDDRVYTLSIEGVLSLKIEAPSSSEAPVNVNRHGVMSHKTWIYQNLNFSIHYVHSICRDTSQCYLYWLPSVSFQHRLKYSSMPSLWRSIICGYIVHAHFVSRLCCCVTFVLEINYFNFVQKLKVIFSRDSYGNPVFYFEKKKIYLCVSLRCFFYFWGVSCNGS